MRKKIHTASFFIIATSILFVVFLLIYYPWPTTHQTPLISHLKILEDKSEKLSLDTVIQHELNFQDTETTTFYHHLSKSTFWLQFTIDSATSDNKFIEIANPNIDEIEVYFPGQEVIHTGRKDSTAQRAMRTRCFYIPIPINLLPNQVVYVRIRTDSIIWLPLKIVTTQEMITRTFYENIIFGGFFGILGALLLVNIFSFIIIRIKKMVLYVFYLIPLFIYHISAHGFLYLIPMPYSVCKIILWISMGCVGISMICFATHFLNLKITMPVVHTILYAGIFCFALQTLIAIFGSTIIATHISVVTGFIIPFIIITSTGKLYYSGHHEFLYYLVALYAMVAGILPWITAIYLQPQLPAHYFFIAGTAAEILLFTLAIFDQIRQELSEKDDMVRREKYYMTLSHTDPLTGLYNRRYLNELIKRLDVNQEIPANSSLVMLDLDNFKQINDTYGHLIGDMLLTKVAGKIKQHIRKTDIACRYGGDEFLVFLPGANAIIAQNIADQIRNDIVNDISYSEEGNEIRHTVSIGITANRMEDSFDGLFLRADAALYQAKNTGRNKITLL